jgi:hypothetical protein
MRSILAPEHEPAGDGRAACQWLSAGSASIHQRPASRVEGEQSSSDQRRGSSAPSAFLPRGMRSPIPLGSATAALPPPPSAATPPPLPATSYPPLVTRHSSLVTRHSSLRLCRLRPPPSAATPPPPQRLRRQAIIQNPPSSNEMNLNVTIRGTDPTLLKTPCRLKASL